MNADELQPRRHDPPAGWNAQTFEAVTDALAAALRAAVTDRPTPEAISTSRSDWRCFCGTHSAWYRPACESCGAPAPVAGEGT